MAPPTYNGCNRIIIAPSSHYLTIINRYSDFIYADWMRSSKYLINAIVDTGLKLTTHYG